MSRAGREDEPASGQKDQGAFIMLKKIIISTAVAASALTALPAAAEAQSRYGYSNRYDNRYDNHYYGQQRYQNYDRRYANQRYYNQRTYNGGYYNHYGQLC